MAQAVDLAVDFRQTFHRDVIIDMWCYRKLGHNETDEPSFTQPIMYKAIAGRPVAAGVYLESLRAMSSGTESRRSPPRTPRPSPPRSARRWKRRWIRPRSFHAPARPSTFAGVWSRRARRPRIDGARRVHRGHRGGAGRGRPGAVHRAARVHRPPQAGAAAEGPGGDGRRAKADRLGHGRGAGLRHPAGRRRARAHVRPGRPPRHLQPPARGADRLRHRRRVHPAGARAPTARGRSRSATARCPRRACSASSTATAWTCPRGW